MDLFCKKVSIQPVGARIGPSTQNNLDTGAGPSTQNNLNTDAGPSTEHNLDTGIGPSVQNYFSDYDNPGYDNDANDYEYDHNQEVMCWSKLEEGLRRDRYLQVPEHSATSHSLKRMSFARFASLSRHWGEF